MRLLVTGGAGFIGSHVVQQALEAGFEVVVLDNFATGKRQNVPDGVAITECDLRDRGATMRALQAVKPDLVSHQAAQASVPVSMADPHFDAEVNILGGLNLLDACLALGAQVRHVVFASTGGAIYGEVPEGERATEAYPLVPKSPYGISKLTFENLLAVYRDARGLRSSVVRYANVYGPRQDPFGEAGVVARFFDAALAARALTVFAMREQGDAGCVRDYVYVGDVARANLLALKDGLGHAVMNVGTGVPTTTAELAQYVVKLTGSKSPVERGGARPGDLERSLLDPTRCQAALGALTSLEQGLTLTARYYASPV